MKAWGNQLSLFATCLIISFAPVKEVFADKILIKELESLRKQLSPTDRTIPKLTTRLADLYFGQITNNIDARKNTKKAIRAYQNILSGFNGKFDKPKGSFNVAVKFNLARLYNRGTNPKKAMVLFSEVYKDNYSSAKFKKESSLSLAEYHEQKNNFSKSQDYYSKSIELCASGDTCAYNHFRLAWLYYREGKVQKAVTEIYPTIFDSKGQVNEQSLRDYKLFVSNLQTDGKKELSQMEVLSQKTNNTDLIREMGEAFYAAGNRKAGTYFIERVFQTDPKLYFRLRLLEEAIGFRNAMRIDELSEGIVIGKEVLPKEEKKAKLTKEILKRVIVQIDAIRKNNKELAPSLKITINLYLNLFPKDNLREKMIDGFLDVVTDDTEKAAELKRFADEEKTLNLAKLELIHRKARLGLLQKIKASDELIAESQILATMTKGDESRKYTYVAARELYAQKKNADAQIVFKEMYKDSLKERKLDKWAVQSLNLDLDILNQKKDYKGIIAVITPFEKSKELFAKSGFSKEFGELEKIQKQAKFENAVALGETKAALDTFFEHCFKQTFGEKACTNAKVLAVKLKDQPKLIKLLERAKDEKALMNEYELMGQFAKAAKLQEKYTLNSKSSVNDILKVALLYELDGDYKNRSRLLNRVWNKLKKQKTLDAKYEPFYYLTFYEAGMLQKSNVLDLAWSENLKKKFIVQLEYFSKGNRKTKKMVLKSKEQLGPTWSDNALAEIIKKDKTQKKQHFYGRRSKRRFQKRVKLIADLKKTAEKYLEGANYETRVIIASILQRSYADLENEIKRTPIPEGLTPEILAQVEVQLNQMSAPFTALQADYAKLMQEQKLKITNQENLQLIDEVLAQTYSNKETSSVAQTSSKQQEPADQTTQSDSITTKQAAVVKSPYKPEKAFKKYPNVDFKKFFKVEPMAPVKSPEETNLSLTQPMVTKLTINPYDKEALSELKDFFAQRDLKRQVKYFENRLSDSNQSDISAPKSEGKK